MSRLPQYDFFCGSQHFFTKISLMFEVLLIIFSSVLQKLICSSRPFHNCFVKLFGHKRRFTGANILSFNCCVVIEYIKNSLFKSSQISVIKVALEYFRSELNVVKVFVITVFDNFRLSFLKTRFKFYCNK